MEQSIQTILDNIKNDMSALRSVTAPDGHTRVCINQALRDLEQAIFFLTDIDCPTIPLEPFLGLE